MHKKETMTNDGYYKYDDVFHVCVKNFIANVYFQVGNFNQFLRLFEIMLMSIYRPKTEFVICGDVNIDFLSYSYMK
jgi:hypothetical protein